MAHPPHLPSRQRDKAANELLLKGIFIACIGLFVLVAPAFMAPTELRGIVAESYLVGWFSLLLGGVLTAKALARRWKEHQARGPGA